MAALGDPTTALTYFRLVLETGARLGHKHIITTALVGCANTLTSTKPETAATLCGFVDAENQRLGVELDPTDSQLRTQAEQCAADAIGARTFSSYREHGALLAARDAIALALGDPSPTPQ